MPTVTHQQAFDIATHHQRSGRLAEAEAIYRQLLAIYPREPELLQLLGVLTHHRGRLGEALPLLEQAIATNPHAFHFHNNLGLLLTDLGRYDAAMQAFQTALRLKPDCPEAAYNLGIALAKADRTREAIAAYREALRLQPDHALALLNLGNALTAAGQMEAAIAHYRTVLAAHPAHADAANNLGNLLRLMARVDEAIGCYRAAILHAPSDPEPHRNLGAALKDCGDPEAALDSYRRSLALDPHRPTTHSGLLLTLYFHPTIPPAEIAAEHRRWDQQHAAPLRAHGQTHPNDRRPDRRLRVGYVSPDFRDHVVGHTLLPCFEAHDREHFDFICYYGTARSDAVTARYRQLATEWRDTVTLTDEQLAAQIRHDRIDVLVDLTLHTAYHRLLAFARRPAPVQVSWLGYPGATGLAAIDYRITDRHLDPPGVDTAGGFEEPIRLPDAWCCYRGRDDAPPPGELPARRRGVITFGSFNNFSKVNERVLALWAEILKAVEGSRLLLLSKGGGEARARRLLTGLGISADRVDFLRYYPPPIGGTGDRVPDEYLRRYLEIDIALDPFPYNGMTTTLDALWMGVPVVALIGPLSLGRASFSLLSNVGLPELAAPSEAEYVQIATALARDLPRLAGLRATLRERMKRSPLLDAPRFARNLEAAYREMWRRWCVGPAGSTASPA